MAKSNPLLEQVLEARQLYLESVDTWAQNVSSRSGQMAQNLGERLDESGMKELDKFIRPGYTGPDLGDSIKSGMEEYDDRIIGRTDAIKKVAKAGKMNFKKYQDALGQRVDTLIRNETIYSERDGRLVYVSGSDLDEQIKSNPGLTKKVGKRK